MRIGIDARFFGTPGKGLGRYTEKLVRSLEELDSVNEYEIFLSPEGFEEYQPAHPRFTKIKVPYPWYGFKEQLFYPFFLWRRQLDLVHFPHFNVPILYGRPYVVTIHDLILLHYPTQKASTRSVWSYYFKYLAYLAVIRLAIKKAQAVLAVSEFTRQDIENFYPEARRKMHLTLEGVDQFCYWFSPVARKEASERYWQEKGRDSKRPYTLYVGNSYPHKNLDTFLFLAKECPEVDIVLVGKKDYFYERLEQKIQKEKIRNIYLVGSVTDQTLGLLYQKAEAYVFPSLYEGFGLPPLEAMQYGVPVLVSNRGSLPEIVGDAALVADPADEAAFLNEYRTLLFNQEVRARLCRQGPERAKNFSWRKMTEATKDIYTKAVNG